MSFNELFFFILLVITLILPLKIFNKNNRLTFSHPLIFYSLVMSYYTVLSPLFRIAINETSSKGFEFRDQFIYGWQGAFLSAFSVLLGYSLKTNFKQKITRYCNLNYEKLWSIGLIINLIGFFSFMVARGFDLSALNPFNPESSSFDFLTYRGGFQNYLVSGQDLLIPGTLLMFSGSYTTKKNFPLTILSIIISCGIFLNSGFRFRLFSLFSSIIVYIIIKENKFRFKSAFNFGIFSVIFSLFLLTYIGQIRRYGYGLNFDEFKISFFFLQDIFIQGESSTFITTSGLMNIVPEIAPFQNFYPILKALLHPFPKVFFVKNSGDYVQYIIDAIYGYENIGFGAAYLNYGEYYYMFGWFGIFIFSFLLGYIYKRLWIWINLHQEEPLAILVYISNLTFTFLIISRGYLAQQLHLYIFIVFPINAIYFFNLRRKLNSTI